MNGCKTLPVRCGEAVSAPVETGPASAARVGKGRTPARATALDVQTAAACACAPSLVYRDCQPGFRQGPRLRIDEVSPQALGREGERLAASYLERRGYVIVERNWTCPYGEADIIALADSVVVFVEVKTRLQRDRDTKPMPELAVNEAKRRRYLRIAACYMAQVDYELMRFDVVAVTIVADRMARMHHIEDVFGSEL